jgi:hypothetical protein
MALVADWGALTVTGVGSLGDQGIRFGEVAAGAQCPDRPAGPKVWSYVVPTGYKLALKSLFVTLYNGAWRAASNDPATMIDAGVAKIKIDAADKWEAKILCGPEPQTGQGGEETVQPFYQPMQQPNLQNGITLTNVNATAITITPSTASIAAGCMYCATLIGKLGTTPTIQTGRLVPSDTTADQTILTYTPPSDWKMVGWTVDVDASGSIVTGALRLELDGMTVWESGPCGMSEMDSMFNRDATPGSGGIWIPTGNMVLYEGQRLALYAHPWSQAGHKIGVHLVGTTTALGGGTVGQYAAAWVG